MPRNGDPPKTPLLKVSALCGALFLILILMDGGLQPGHRSPGQILQALALGPVQLLQVLYGVCAIIFAIAFSQYLLKSSFLTWRSPHCGLLFIGVGLVISGGLAQPVYSWNPDIPWPGKYWGHLLAGGAVSLLIPITLFWFARHFRRSDDDDDDALATWTVVAGVITLAIVVGLILFPPQHLNDRVPIMTFVARRSHFIVLLLWCIGVAAWNDLRRNRAEIAGGDSNSSAADDDDKRRREEVRAPDGFNWEMFAAKIEVLTLPLVLVGGVIALLEYSDGHKRDVREVSQRAYEKADENWMEFLKACADHPEADCYDGHALPARAATVAPGGAAAGATGDVAATAKQSAFPAEVRGAVLSLLIDTFEVAYLNYNDREYASDDAEGYCSQWPTWMVAMRKFARRAPFQETWDEVGNEYDTRFADCMKDTIAEQKQLTAAELADAEKLRDPPPKRCRLEICDYDRAAARDAGASSP